MKNYKYILTAVLSLLFLTGATQWYKTFAIGSSSIDASSLFDVTSTTKGARPFPTMTEVQRDAIGTPATGLMVYNSDTDKVNIYDGSAWTEVAGGGGQGGINYVINTDFESNTDDVTVTNDITKAAETTDPIRGVQSLKATISSLQTGTDYVDIAMNDIDNRDIGKALYISFDYTTDANYTTDDVKVILRNNDSSNDVLVRGGNGSGQIAAASGKVSFTGVAYLDPTDNSYSLRIQVVSAPSSNSTITIDNVVVGPQAILDSPIVGYQDSYIPTITHSSGGMTNYTTEADYWRSGDRLVVEGAINFSGASAAFSDIYVSLPSGLSANVSRMKGEYNFNSIGTVNTHDIGTAVHSGSVFAQSGTQVGFRFYYDTVASAVNAITTDTPSATFPQTWANGDFITFQFSLPITEWANQTAVLSTTEMMNKTVAMSIYASSMSIAHQTTEGSETKVTTFTSPIIDTVDAWDSASDHFVIPSDGIYRVTARAIKPTTTGANAAMIKPFYNGAALDSRFSRYDAPSAQNDVTLNYSSIHELTKGSTLDLRIFQNHGVSLSFSDINLQVEKLHDLSVYSVYGNYETLSATSSTKTPSATGHFLSMTGNSLDLSTGKWRLYGVVNYRSSGSSGFTRWDTGWYSANGADSGSRPSQVFSNGSITRGQDINLGDVTATDHDVQLNIIEFTVTGDSETIYAVPYWGGGTPANARVSVSIWAERIQ